MAVKRENLERISRIIQSLLPIYEALDQLENAEVDWDTRDWVEGEILP